MQFSLQYQVNREELYSLFINHRGIDLKKKTIKMAATKFAKTANVLVLSLLNSFHVE